MHDSFIKFYEQVVKKIQTPFNQLSSILTKMNDTMYAFSRVLLTTLFENTFVKQRLFSRLIYTAVQFYLLISLKNTHSAFRTNFCF